jgi:hypothetical protein
MAPHGSAYVFLLPFEIHTAETLQTPIDSHVDGRRVIVYPPFKNGEGLRLHRPISIQNVPHQRGTVQPARRLPELNVAANPNWPVAYVLGDALRLDIYDREEVPVAVADEIGKRLLRLLRMTTRQWWIMRGASESLAPLQYHFPIDAWGQPLGVLHGTQHVIPWLRSEALVTAETLRVACEYLAANIDVPPSCSTLFDSVFAMLHGDIGQAVLLAAIACEALFSEETFAAVTRGECTPGVARQARKIKDLRERVDVGACSAFHRSFTNERPEDAANLGQLWLARHALAHGSQAQQERSAVLHDEECGANAMKGAFSFFHWIANLQPRNVPDPLAVFSQPLLPDA